MNKRKIPENMHCLKGKTAIVTGAGGILGEVFCRSLAKAGANVALMDINKRGIENLSKKLAGSYRTKAVATYCDVSNKESVEKAVSKTLREFGRIDILLNNAATKTSDLRSFFASFEDYSLKTWRKVMSVNIDGMFLVAQAVGRHMAKQKTGGSIIQTASIYGILAPDNRIYKGSKYLGCQINSPAAYVVSKAAVIGLTKYLATYWADKNIRVNALVPGGIESGQNSVFKRSYANRVPMKRMARAEELIGTVLYLASDASSYVTGQSLVVDGGLSAW